MWTVYFVEWQNDRRELRALRNGGVILIIHNGQFACWTNFYFYFILFLFILFNLHKYEEIPGKNIIKLPNFRGQMLKNVGNIVSYYIL